MVLLVLSMSVENWHGWLARNGTDDFCSPLMSHDEQNTMIDSRLCGESDQLHECCDHAMMMEG